MDEPLGEEEDDVERMKEAQGDNMRDAEDFHAMFHLQFRNSNSFHFNHAITMTIENAQKRRKSDDCMMK